MLAENLSSKRFITKYRYKDIEPIIEILNIHIQLRRDVKCIDFEPDYPISRKVNAEIGIPHSLFSQVEKSEL
jgi:hypothetical protein